jgi:hypothetical protein
MGWNTLGTQFALELGFGVFAALIWVHRAPLGVFFFRLMGTAALLPVLAAVLLPFAAGAPALDAVTLAGGGLAILCYPFYSGSVRVRTRLLALSAAAAGTAVALATVVRSAAGVSGGDWAIASVSAAATGCVAGGVGLAMVLGHWYLTIPNLEIRHLARLNRITLWCMAASLASVALAYVALFDAGPASALGAWGALCLGTRVAVGILMPMLFGWMAAQSLRYRNTRSATGILYASTVLVLIGAAASVSLQDAYGVPL